ncbi:transposase [candidate division KSB1 bacterium]|nr:transposase [candidate division KSB1 bacterium]
MYEWRKMTHLQRTEALRIRKEKHFLWHNPPHIVGDTYFYHLSAACYEHSPVIGHSAERLAAFSEFLINGLTNLSIEIFAWCVLPNHYHLLLQVDNLLMLIKEIGKLHSRTSYQWNGDENCRGRQVWFNCSDRYIRGERHFWVTMNYIHHNPVHHNYVEKWQDWPFCSANDFINSVGEKQAAIIWNQYPILEYGKGWDDPKI